MVNKDEYIGRWLFVLSFHDNEGSIVCSSIGLVDKLIIFSVVLSAKMNSPEGRAFLS